ncbi:hypothetical protein SNE40_019716 [Patella caerulea]|uniref:TIR domain-containing protein n=1 Tax=Patella caerulea TaxID=87958 RepID=A0AAN8P6F3_PATCE
MTLLDLSFNNITTIEIGAFYFLRHTLKELDLSDNTALGFETLGDSMFGLVNSTLKVLKINRIVNEYRICVCINKTTLKYFKYTVIEKIYVDGNRIDIFQKGAILLLPDTLKYVSAKSNRFTLGTYLHSDPLHVYGIQELDLSYQMENDRNLHDLYINYRNDFTQQRRDPIQCNNGLKLKKEIRTQPDSQILIHIPPNLTTLYLDNLQLPFCLSHMRFSNNSLGSVSLAMNNFWSWEGPISGVKTIKHLNLSNNFCNKITPGFFCEFTSLETLDLRNNFLESAICSDTNGTLFSNLTQLKEINLSYNNLWFIPKNLFRGLIKCEKIDLGHNNMLSKHFFFTIRHMVNLSSIDFKENGLKWISESMQLELEFSGNLTVDFSDNKFYCICDYLSFLSWMFSTRRLHFKNFDNYVCDFMNGTIVTFANKELIFNELNIKCENKLWYFFGALGGTLTLVGIIIGTSTYRFRWKLRYLYYSARRSNKIHHENDDSFEYDAFISYSEDARLFVDQTMKLRIEEEAGLKLCLHNRDFLPSLPIAEGIVTAVKTSRKTVLVMSPDFVKSYWCLYEMNMADMESQHTGRDVLLILLYKHIKYDQIPPTVMYQIKSHTYIEYPNTDDDSEEMDIFWDNFKIAIEC